MASALVLAALLTRALANSYLVLIGGALDPDNADVYNRVISNAGGPLAVMCVSGVNAADPEDSEDFYYERFTHFGVSDVIKMNITVENAHETAFSPWSLEALANCTGLFFGGGDQSNAIAALYDGEKDTPVLAYVRQRLRDAALNASAPPFVLAGTSAGCALQSNPMITGGSSFDSVSATNMSDAVTVGRGIGFLRGSIMVDQHFSERGRLGRLIWAMRMGARDIGIAVDEDTALNVDLSGGGDRGSLWEVVGSSYVTVVQNLRWSGDSNTVAHAEVSFLSEGDRVIPETMEIQAADNKIPVAPSVVPCATSVTEAQSIFDPLAYIHAFAPAALSGKGGFVGHAFASENNGRIGAVDGEFVGALFSLSMGSHSQSFTCPDSTLPFCGAYHTRLEARPMRLTETEVAPSPHEGSSLSGGVIVGLLVAGAAAGAGGIGLVWFLRNRGHSERLQYREM